MRRKHRKVEGEGLERVEMPMKPSEAGGTEAGRRLRGGDEREGGVRGRREHGSERHAHTQHWFLTTHPNRQQ